MSSIQTLLESANPWKSLQSDAGKLASKWSKTGLLEGFNSEVDKNNMSILLENQAKQLVVESSATGQGGTFTVGQSENWAGIALPLVRKVFGGIAAKEFVSVQPMNLPSGLVFFLDFQYGTSANPFASGGSLYGTRNATGQFPFATPSPVGGLYGAGRFAYTTNQFSSSILITGSLGGGTLPVVTAGTATVVTASWAECNFDAAYSASAIGNRIYKITVTASALTNFDPDGVRAFVGTSASIFTAANQIQELTTYNYTANSIALFYTASSTLAAQPITALLTVFYNKSTADNTRGDFEDTTGTPSVPNAQSATTIVIPEINIKMQSQAITAKTKKLKAVWTPEFAQDLNAYQNIDAEAELTNIMSEYISMEIDLEILDMLIEDAAAATEYWDVNNNSVINATGTAFIASTSGFYNTQGGWFQTLGTKMQKVSNKIHQLTLRGGANFLVCSPTVATILESIPGFAANTNGDASNNNFSFVEIKRSLMSLF